MEKIKKTSAAIEKFTTGVGYISFVCVIAIMLLAVVDVAMGALFKVRILGAYEITQRLLMCAVFTSFAYAQSKKAHINMTIVVDKFPRAICFGIFAAMSVLSVIAAGAMTWAAGVQTGVCITKGYVTEVLYFPLWPFYVIETLAMGIFTLALVYDTALYIMAIFREDVAGMIREDWEEAETNG